MIIIAMAVTTVAAAAAMPLRPATGPLSHQPLTVFAPAPHGHHQSAPNSPAPGAARQAASQPLNLLRCHGLIGYVVLPRSKRTRAWYLTSEGTRLTRDFPALLGCPPYRGSRAAARTPLTGGTSRSRPRRDRTGQNQRPHHPGQPTCGTSQPYRPDHLHPLPCPYGYGGKARCPLTGCASVKTLSGGVRPPAKTADTCTTWNKRQLPGHLYTAPAADICPKAARHAPLGAFAADRSHRWPECTHRPRHAREHDQQTLEICVGEL